MKFKSILILTVLCFCNLAKSQTVSPGPIAPIQYVVFSGTLTNTQSETNSTNTYLPAVGRPNDIGVTISQTNSEFTNIVGSNYTATLYVANDAAGLTSGWNSPGLYPVPFGTNFGKRKPLLTISNTVTSTNDVFTTNIPSGVYGVATSFQWVISNNFSSNASITLVQQVLP
jgi:hypothetical protein